MELGLALLCRVHLGHFAIVVSLCQAVGFLWWSCHRWSRHRWSLRNPAHLPESDSGLALQLWHAPNGTLVRNGRARTVRCDGWRGYALLEERGATWPLELSRADQLKCKVVVVTSGDILSQSVWKGGILQEARDALATFWDVPSDRYEHLSPAIAAAAAVRVNMTEIFLANKQHYAAHWGYCHVHVATKKALLAAALAAKAAGSPLNEPKRLQPHYWRYFAVASLIGDGLLVDPEGTWLMTVDLDALITDFSREVGDFVRFATAETSNPTSLDLMAAGGASCRQFWDFRVRWGSLQCSSVVREYVSKHLAALVNERCVEDSLSTTAVEETTTTRWREATAFGSTQRDAAKPLPSLLLAADGFCERVTVPMNSGVLLWRGSGVSRTLARSVLLGHAKSRLRRRNYDGHRLLDQPILTALLEDRHGVNWPLLTCSCMAGRVLPRVQAPGTVMQRSEDGHVVVVAPRTFNSFFDKWQSGDLHSRWVPGDFVAHFAGAADRRFAFARLCAQSSNSSQVCPRRKGEGPPAAGGTGAAAAGALYVRSV